MATTPGEKCMAFSALSQVGSLLTKLYHLRQKQYLGMIIPHYNHPQLHNCFIV